MGEIDGLPNVSKRQVAGGRGQWIRAGVDAEFLFDFQAALFDDSEAEYSGDLREAVAA